jgi:hypothetical protein
MPIILAIFDFLAVSHQYLNPSRLQRLGGNESAESDAMAVAVIASTGLLHVCKQQMAFTILGNWN